MHKNNLLLLQIFHTNVRSMTHYFKVDLYLTKNQSKVTVSRTALRICLILNFPTCSECLSEREIAVFSKFLWTVGRLSRWSVTFVQFEVAITNTAEVENTVLSLSLYSFFLLTLSSDVTLWRLLLRFSWLCNMYIIIYKI